MAQNGDKPCARCGKPGAGTMDHVIPSNLYPPSKASVPVNRITVEACGSRNSGMLDDELHFWNVLIAGGRLGRAARGNP